MIKEPKLTRYKQRCVRREVPRRQWLHVPRLANGVSAFTSLQIWKYFHMPQSFVGRHWQDNLLDTAETRGVETYNGKTFLSLNRKHISSTKINVQKFTAATFKEQKSHYILTLMSAQHNTSSASSFPLPLDFKFVAIFRKTTEDAIFEMCLSTFYTSHMMTLPCILRRVFKWLWSISLEKRDINHIPLTYLECQLFPHTEYKPVSNTKTSHGDMLQIYVNLPVKSMLFLHDFNKNRNFRGLLLRMQVRYLKQIRAVGVTLFHEDKLMDSCEKATCLQTCFSLFSLASGEEIPWPLM